MAHDLYENYTSTSTSFHGHSDYAFDMYHDMFERFIAPHLPKHERETIKILDIGCGWGGLLKVLQEKGYTQSEGFDLSQEQVDNAVSLGINNVTTNTIESFFETSTPNSYDVIILFDVLEHFPSDEGVKHMKAIQSMLKPGGKIILQVPNGASLISINYYSDVTHFKAFTPVSLGQVSKMAGFSSIECQEALPYLTGNKKRLSRFLWQILIKPFPVPIC